MVAERGKGGLFGRLTGGRFEKHDDYFEMISGWMLSHSAYILKVCTQQMCPHVPVPLSPLPLHLLLPLAEAVLAEPGGSEAFNTFVARACDS